ncbi:MAG: DUF4382 domain-containing protein [Desulfobacterales bacterium]|nr:DUF4382 domain-containing protein [Desulfobacterales bacterium]
MNRWISLAAALLLIAGHTGCASSNDEATSPSSGTGTLTIFLTDAPSEEFKAIYLSLIQVEVKIGDDDNDNAGWQIVDVISKTINLLSLTGGNREQLGSKTMAARLYAQVRLRLSENPAQENNVNGVTHPYAHYLIKNDNTVVPLTIDNTLYDEGIKLTTAILVSRGGTTRLTLDVDAVRSVVRTTGSNWRFKPVVRAQTNQLQAIISGSVTDTATPTPNALQGVRLSAQTYDSSQSHIEDQVTVHTSTLTDAAGNYTLYTTGKNYHMVAFAKNQAFQCSEVEAVVTQTKTVNFALGSATPGTLRLNVSGLDSDQGPALVQIFREGICEGTETTAYEVTAQAIGETGSYDIALPPGVFKVVASGEGLTTKRPSDPTITSGGTTSLTLTF